MISKILQHVLLVIGVVALFALVIELVQSVAATTHGSTPARVVNTTAGPYNLTVDLYRYPANAGFALPFSVTVAQPAREPVAIDVTTVPGQGVDATPVHASTTVDAHNPNAIQGSGEIPVKGTWYLQVTVTGPQRNVTTTIPITATAPPPIPFWLGWLIGSVPLVGLFTFLLVKRKDVGLTFRHAVGTTT